MIDNDAHSPICSVRVAHVERHWKETYSLPKRGALPRETGEKTRMWGAFWQAAGAASQEVVQNMLQ